MIVQETFVAAPPAQAAAQLGDAVHLWRLPYRRGGGRAPLRALLATYLGEDATTLTLHEDEHGKPCLPASRDGRSQLHFNWSHSGEFALVALVRDMAVGVDIEQQRDDVRVIEIARRFFHPTEAQALVACSDGERDAMFFRLWCAKEAVLKALGRGLVFGLERIAFERDGGRWRPCDFNAEAGASAAWQVHGIAPAPGYAGALAWHGAARPVLAWRLPEQ